MQQIKMVFVLMALMVVSFSVPSISAEKIHCSDDIDFEKYPICKYEVEWNESEKFNEKLIEALGERQNEINKKVNTELGEDEQQEIYLDRYLEVYREVYNTVDQENPGLLEQGESLKEWIYKQLEE